MDGVVSKEQHEKSLKIAEDISSQQSFRSLTRGIGHEIQNILGVIISGMDLIAETTDNKESLINYTNIVKKSVLRASEITNALIHYGTSLSDEHQKSNLNQLIEEIQLLIKGECKKRKISVSTSLTNSAPILCNENQLFQALLCLIQNSIQAIQKNGEIHFETSLKKNHISLSISDNGSGISTDILPKIFDPFFTTKPECNGLGLPLVKRVIHEHNGTIEIQSSENKGTKVILSLPLFQETAITR